MIKSFYINSKFNKFNFKTINFLSWIFFVGILCFLVYDNFNPETKKNDNINSFVENFSIEFFDVGKADSALVRFGHHAVLIDAAEKNSATSVKDKLNQRGIKKFDFVVLTHPHSDHYGQMPEILKKFIIKYLVTAKSGINSHEKSNFKKIIRKFKKMKIPIKFVKSGDIIKIDNVVFKILGPSKKYTNINNNSVVMQILYKNHSFLLTGDMEKAAEKDLLNLYSGESLKSNIIKIAHHGSSTSSTEAFLSKVNPKIAIISSGKYFNSAALYPSTKTLSTLEKLKIKTYITEKVGSIIASVIDDKIIIKTEKNDVSQNQDIEKAA
ncbi:MAG: MBL fold metallo-hydrolase [Oscillospiraceae bacterium]|jgi:competence protein ComEC|nr:MBL fold metallo-hydrolase [Oscillospiraceae bacterium]